MGNNFTYEAWEALTPIPAPCSYLYSLSPIGVGTAAVESFTSYITRLAAAHAVEAGALVNTELLPRVPCTKGESRGGVPTKKPTSFFIEASPLNGTGERARAWVNVLERLTGVHGLDLLTLLPWSKAISCVHLLRVQRAWCPYCYGKPTDDVDQQTHDRLLWNFQVVTACPVHGCPLESICSSCTKEQYVFAPRMRSGYCSRCQAWLGRAAQAPSGDQDESVQIAGMVGELLAASPHLPSGFGLDQFRENMRALRSCRQFHSVIVRRNVRGWMNVGSAPRMDSLVLLSQCQKTSVLRLLNEPIAVEPRICGRPPHTPHTHCRVDGPTVEAALQAALREEVPPPLDEIATQVGYLCAESLRFRFRDLCQEIVRKRNANLKLVPVPIPRERIEHALSEALHKDSQISLSSLAKSIGLRNRRRLYKGFHNLREAVVEHNRQHRRQRRTVIESALRAALEEAPVPPLKDVAQRLGCKSSGTLTRQFPELSAALKRRRQAELDNARTTSPPFAFPAR